MTDGPSPVEVGAELELDVGAGRPRRPLRGPARRARWSSSGTPCRGSGSGPASPRVPSKFLRADAVEVLEAAARPRRPALPARAPRGLRRLRLAARRPGDAARPEGGGRGRAARAAWPASTATSSVEELPGAPDGLRWRTRERFSVDPATGRLGLHRHRSNDVVVLDDCPLAHPGVVATGVLARSWTGAESVQVAASPTTDDVAVVVDGVAQGARRVRERAAGREWRVAADGFWQVHPAAADTLTDAVVEALGPAAGGARGRPLRGCRPLRRLPGRRRRGHRAGGRRRGIRRRPSRDARRNLARPAVGTRCTRATSGAGSRPEASGAATSWSSTRRARAPAQTWCAASPAGARGRSPTSPATRRRWPATSRPSPVSAGELAALRAFDLFPMTHHVECVATLRPLADAGRRSDILISR